MRLASLALLVVAAGCSTVAEPPPCSKPIFSPLTDAELFAGTVARRTAAVPAARPAGSSAPRDAPRAAGGTPAVRHMTNRRNKKGESLLVECLAAIKRIDPQLATRALDTLPEARAQRARERGTRIDWPNLT